MKRFLSVLLALCSMLPMMISAAVINVPADQVTIQLGLNTATEGDTVLVAPGTYHENIVWPQTSSIKLFSSGDSTNTILDGQQQGSVITVTMAEETNDIIDTTTVISGFTIQNGLAPSGGGIICNYAGPKLQRLLIKNNEANSESSFSGGGGFFVNHGDPAIINVNVNENTAHFYGGGIYVLHGNPTFKDVAVNRNTAGQGAGIYISGENPTFTHITVNGNTAGKGGGIFVWGGNPTFTDIVISNNTAASTGGGIYILSNNSTFTNVTVNRNTATHNGAGIHMSLGYGSVLVESCSFFENQTESNYGYTISSETNNSIRFVNSNIFDPNARALVNNNSAMIADAGNCWWGDASGPHHPTQNPTGTGGKTQIYVNVTPWLTSPSVSAPPLPVAGLTLVSQNNNCLEFAWDPSPITDIVGYKIYYDSDDSGSPYNFSVNAFNNTEIELQNLLPGQTYYVAVTCYDADGNESLYSQEIEATTRNTETQNVHLVDVVNLTHTLNHTPTIAWDYFDSIDAAQGAYQVQVAIDETFETLVWETGFVNDDATSVAYAGEALENGQSYFLRVRVKTADEYVGKWSELSFRMNTAPLATTLLDPENDTVLRDNPTFLWNAAQEDPEGDAICYILHVYTDETCETEIFNQSDITETSLLVETLPDNQMYWWNVTVTDGFETSEASNTYHFLKNVTDDPPTAFSLVAPTNGSTCCSGDTTLLWQANGDPDYNDIIHYIVLLSRTNDFTAEVDSFITSEPQLNVHNLQQNQGYWWKVRAQDSNTTGTWSTEAWAINGYAPQAPSAFDLVDPADELTLDTLRYTFDWEASIADELCESLTYELELSTDETFPDTTVTFYRTARDSFEVPVMMDDTDYWWRVRAVDDRHLATLSTSTFRFHTAWPQPPVQFDLEGPEDGSIIGENENFAATFTWAESSDPDPEETVEYRMSVTVPLPSGHDTTLVYDGLTTPTLELSLTDSLHLEYWPETTATWQIFAISNGDTVASESSWNVTILERVNSVDDLFSTLPVKYELAATYPNPFNPTTTVMIGLPERSDLTVEVYNILGQRVATLADRSFDAGYQKFVFDANSLSSGVYFVHANVPGKLNQMQKIVLVR